MENSYRKSMTWLHTYTGLILGWLLFAIFVSGTSSYYEKEITIWMKPELHKSQESEKTLDIAIDKALENIENSNRVSIELPNNRNNTIKVTKNNGRNHHHHHGPNDEHSQVQKKGDSPSGKPDLSNPSKSEDKKEKKRGPRPKPEYYDASTGEKLEARDTQGGGFLYRLHFELYNLPRDVASWIVGIAAMSMLIAIISGVIMHKRIIKDIFTFRPKNGPRGWMDAHILPAVAALPFLIMITYSGLILLAETLMPWALNTHYNGNFGKYIQDIDKVIIDKKVNTNEFTLEQKIIQINNQINKEETNSEQNEVNLKAILTKGNDFYKNGISSFTITKDPVLNSIKVEIKPNEDTSIFSYKRDKDSITFDANSGKLLKISKAGSTQSTIYDTENTFRSLHMALFADSILRFIFFIFGISGIVLVGTGLILWTEKRKNKSKKSFGFWLVEKLNIGTIVGLFIAIGIYFIANRLISIEETMRSSFEINAFFIAWAASYIHAFIRNTKKAWIEQLTLASLLFLTLPILNALMTFENISWIYDRDSILIGFDLFFIFLFLVFSLITFIARKKFKKGEIQ